MKPKGFTLVELLVVVIIISILASYTIITYLDQKRRSEHRGAMAIARSLAAAVKNQFYASNAITPTSSTNDSNNQYGLGIREGTFFNYSVVLDAPFDVTVSYNPRGSGFAPTASYVFNSTGGQSSCTGADCEHP